MVDERVAFPPIRDTTKVVQPGTGAFDHISSGIAPQFSTVVARRLRAVLAVRADEINSLTFQAVAEGVGMEYTPPEEVLGLVPVSSEQ